jgi:hypothetical protein
VDVSFVFLGGVGIVETKIAGAAEFGRDAEVQADRLGMANMQEAVRLGRKPRDNLVMQTGVHIHLDLVTDEIMGGVVGGGVVSIGHELFFYRGRALSARNAGARQTKTARQGCRAVLRYLVVRLLADVNDELVGHRLAPLRLEPFMGRYEA